MSGGGLNFFTNGRAVGIVAEGRGGSNQEVFEFAKLNYCCHVALQACPGIYLIPHFSTSGRERSAGRPHALNPGPPSTKRKDLYDTPLLSHHVVLLGACGNKAPETTQQQPAPPPKPAPSVPNIKVTQAAQDKAATPKPGPKATKQEVADTFGKGKASVAIKGHPGGVQHSFWVEEVDVDGSGNPVQVDEAWDNHHKVLYLSRERSFTCGNGQSATGSTLMAIYGKGNTLKKTPGSGWWVAELDAGACGVQEAGVYGCRFDAAGNNTECGEETIQSEADDVTIVPLPGGRSASSNSAPGAPSGPSSTPSTPAPDDNKQPAQSNPNP
jgi:hypothetical protein